MSTTKYDEDFKKSLVTLYQNGKTQAQLCREYGVSESALCKWVKQYATVQTDDGEVLTAKQVKELQKRNAQLEEENLILKKGACQEFCVNEIKTFEKSIENDVDLCHFFAYVSHPDPHRRSSLPRMIPQLG